MRMTHNDIQLTVDPSDCYFDCGSYIIHGLVDSGADTYRLIGVASDPSNTNSDIVDYDIHRSDSDVSADVYLSGELRTQLDEFARAAFAARDA